MAPKSVFIIMMSKDFVLEGFLLRVFKSCKTGSSSLPQDSENSSSFVKGFGLVLFFFFFFFVIILILFCGMLYSMPSPV